MAFAKNLHRMKCFECKTEYVYNQMLASDRVQHQVPDPDQWDADELKEVGIKKKKMRLCVSCELKQRNKEVEALKEKHPDHELLQSAIPFNSEKQIQIASTIKMSSQDPKLRSYLPQAQKPNGSSQSIY